MVVVSSAISSWTCGCGSACPMPFDWHACDVCGWTGCSQQCVQPQSSGSGKALFRCLWCIASDAQPVIEIVQSEVIPVTASVPVDVFADQHFRCSRCMLLKKARGSLFCESVGCRKASCGCDLARWFVCPYQRMLNNFRLKGVCPGCLEQIQHLEQFGCHHAVLYDRDGNDANRDDRLRRQFLSLYVQLEDPHRSLLVQEYICSLDSLEVSFFDWGLVQIYLFNKLIVICVLEIVFFIFFYLYLNFIF